MKLNPLMQVRKKRADLTTTDNEFLAYYVRRHVEDSPHFVRSMASFTSVSDKVTNIVILFTLERGQMSKQSSGKILRGDY